MKLSFFLSINAVKLLVSNSLSCLWEHFYTLISTYYLLQPGDTRPAGCILAADEAKQTVLYPGGTMDYLASGLLLSLSI